ncbi:MAG TPA: dienelactone hydrolase family protein [Caulobacteraceae bacterium]|nr:dienelactone hydrolase family protein [Caulobacteraceae bacterium]
MSDDVGLVVKAEGAAAQPEVISLWPDGPPSTLPGVGPEATFRAPAAGGADTTMLRNVSDPTLTVFRPDPAKANGVGVIVCPGGGWRILAWEHEGIDLANWLAARGYAAFLLKYRLMATPDDPAEFAKTMAQMAQRSWDDVPAMKAPRALRELLRDEMTGRARDCAADDGRRALQIIRDRAADFGVEPARVGMIGFSAGAFLTSDIAMDPGGAPLAFAAPIYGGETCGRPVPPEAPPLFTVIAQDDRMLFKVVEGLYADWSNADRPAELHIFTKGAHGFGMVRRGLPVDRWVDLFGDWLVDQGLA